MPYAILNSANTLLDNGLKLLALIFN